MTGRIRMRYHVTGVVQGVGFRPFVYVTASRLGLCGCVNNDGEGVHIEVEGPSADVDELGRRLRADAPPLAVVERISAERVAVVGGTGFEIVESDRRVTATRTFVGPDVATCVDCLREMSDPADRRYRHGLISCTNCGPRFSIIRDLPYDRPTTTMSGFPMCPACAAEYADPGDRRFHAQTIACHDCGPTLELIRPDAASCTGDDAVIAARELLRAGAVVAVKGLGGYHLACDAHNEVAVRTLRERKRRGDKPFAVMVADLETARSLAEIDAIEEALLGSSRRPVVLLARTDAALLAGSVAPGSPDLGLILPYTPVHALLLDGAEHDALVMTSGNLGGEPIAYRDEDALVRLAPMADAWLRHDRPIHVPVDDSVTRVVDGREAAVRRSRGYAPLPVALPSDVPATLATGADLKNTCALARGRYAWLSQHVGDMDDLATLAAFGDSAAHLERLVGVAAQQIAADAHPGYRSTAWARRHASGRPVRTVQHHHAHIASVMAEHGLDGHEQVIGFAFDGTGYGADGAVWGGEVLIADYKEYLRAAHLEYVALPGGDSAVQRPYRMALSHLRAAGVDWSPDIASVRACGADEQAVIAHQISTGFGSVPTSSMGRLFDAVASLAGVRQVVDYEAQAAIELEALARGVAGVGHYEFAMSDAEATYVVSAAPVVRAVVSDCQASVAPHVVSARFHAGVADLVTRLAVRIRDRSGLTTVALGGGVFANAVLLSACRRELDQRGFAVLTAEQLPTNDGGLALGQVMVAAAG